MNKKETLTLRRYAERCGTTHKTVGAAIKSGRIDKGYDRKSKQIIPDIADLEWGTAFIAKRVDSSVPQEWLDNLSHIPVEAIEIHLNDSIAEAERKKTIIQAQRDLLRLKTESGELVSKDAVYKELFGKAREIKLALQAIPDRIIDQIVSLDRNQAHKLLSEEINQVLLKLSNENLNDA